MSRYDNYSRGRSGHHRDHSPEYKYSGASYPVSYEESRRLAQQDDPAYDDETPPQKLLTYEPNTPFYPSESPTRLEVPNSHSRPRSLPPPDEYRRSTRGRRSERGYSKYDDSEDSDDSRARTPVDKARNFVDNTFTNSTAGLGIGVLGALVGGLAVREAVDATSKHNNYNHDDADHKRNQLIGTVVGAAVGALGANAVEKRLEAHRERDRIKHEKWERKYRPDPDVVEKREVMARPHSSSVDGYGRKRDWDPWDEPSRDHDRDRGGRNRAMEREVDPDARSWKNVEDWLYDDRNDTKPRSSGHRGAEGEYRY